MTTDSGEQLAQLYAALGDHRTSGLPDGIFEARLGGPGGVADLADLGAAEWQIDLLPFPPAPEQRAALAGLGYTLAAEAPEQLVFRRPGGIAVVLLSHEMGASHGQRLLWEHLGRPEARPDRAEYRRVYRAAGREAADRELRPRAEASHVAREGFGPLERASALLTPLGLPWMFAAGWALDLHAHSRQGRLPSRPHEDVDVIIRREDQLTVGRALSQAGYSVYAVKEGGYLSWDTPLEAPSFQMHAHRAGGEMLDVMLSDLGGDIWRYRRDPSITLPLARARLESPSGLPYLAPEAALLFKSSPTNGVVRPKDQRDFDRVRTVLDAQAAGWLAAHLPGEHVWQELLKA